MDSIILSKKPTENKKITSQNFLSIQDFCALIPHPVFVFDKKSERLTWSNYLAKESAPFIVLGISIKEYQQIITSIYVRDKEIDTPFDDAFIFKILEN